MHNYRFLSFAYNDLNAVLNASGCVNCTDGWVEKGKGTKYRIWVVLSGKMKIIYKDEEYTLSENDLFWFSEGNDYTALALCENTSFLYLNFYIFNDVTRTEKVIQLNLDGKYEYGVLKDEINILIKNADHYLPFDKSVYRYSFFSGIILIIFSRIYDIYYDTMTPSDIMLKINVSKISKVIEYIYNHKGDKLTTKKLAEIADVSEKTLYNQFMKIKGVTPHGFVWNVKMKYAVTLINQKKYSIKEIAQMVGYDDPQTFASVFKRWIGVSPSKFNK